MLEKTGCYIAVAPGFLVQESRAHSRPRQRLSMPETQAALNAFESVNVPDLVGVVKNG